MKLKAQKNVVEHAGSGLMLPEDMARRIDAIAKDLPKDFTYHRVAKSASEFRIDSGQRTDVSVITTESVDREGECVLSSGIDKSEYNNVVPFEHNYKALPVGSCWWARPDGEYGWAAKTHYPPAPPDWKGDWMPSAILHLMQQPVPVCTAKSIGFIPISIRAATRQEIEQRPELRNAKIVTKSKLLEYSVATVPVNPDAEMLAVSKCLSAGLFTEDFAQVVTKSIKSQIKGFNMPTPNSGESEQDFVSRCVPFMHKEGKYDDPKQILAVCYGIYKEHKQKAVQKSYDARKMLLAHLDLNPPKDVQKAHKKGVEAYEKGYGKDVASPEMCAMSRHVAEGGAVSADYAHKAATYHEKNPHHMDAQEGTPAHCLSMLHGGQPGKDFYGSIKKSMDEVGAQPTTSYDENGTPPGVIVHKAEGASEGNSADGGNATPTQTGTNMKKCPHCKSEKVSKKDMNDGGGMDSVSQMSMKCEVCGKAFSESEMITDTGVESISNDPVSEQDKRYNTDGGTPKEMPGGTKPYKKAMEGEEKKDDEDDKKMKAVKEKAAKDKKEAEEKEEADKATAAKVAMEKKEKALTSEQILDMAEKVVNSKMADIEKKAMDMATEKFLMSWAGRP